MATTKAKAKTKRIQINKANSFMVAVIAGTAFIATFSLVSARALWTQQTYQSRIIKTKEKAREQLKANIKAADSLTSSYQDFVGNNSNLLGGNPSGQGDRDGDNGKIVLDALPSKYDFPALATSMEKVMSAGPYKLKSISGTDEEVGQASSEAQQKTGVVEIPLSLSVEGSFAGMREATDVLDRSIRPISIEAMTISGTDSLMTLGLTAKTYYQPAKTLQINSKVVK